MKCVTKSKVTVEKDTVSEPGSLFGGQDCSYRQLEELVKNCPECFRAPERGDVASIV